MGTLHRCYIMRKAIRKEVTAGGRFDFFLDSGRSHSLLSVTIKYETSYGGVTRKIIP